MLLQASALTSALVMSQTDCCSRSNSCCISVSDSGGLSDPRLRVPRYAMAAKSKEQWCYGSDDNKPNGNGIREIGGCNEEVECRIGGHESAGNCPLDLSVPRRGFIRSLSLLHHHHLTLSRSRSVLCLLLSVNASAIVVGSSIAWR
jgi:hypothetical protein